MIGGTLFRRFFWRFLAGTAFAFLVFVALVHLFQIRQVDREWREQLRQEALWLARHSQADHAAALADAWRSMHEAVRVTFYDSEGALLADSHPERAAIELAPVREGREPPGQLAVAEELRVGGWMVMSRPYGPAFPSGMYGELALAMLLILGPMILLLYPLARSMSSTLHELAEMAREVSAGSFGRQLPASRAAAPGELGELVRSFNDMSAKLAEAERLSSRLLHDVSHELRSPLGRIQVLAETVAARPAERAECLRGIEQEIRLLDRLVEDLLQVARSESDLRRSRPEDFSLVHWAGEVLARLERSVRAHGLGWSARLPERDATVRGDPQHLALALANLVDNAVHALRGREDGAIEVSVGCDGERWSLAVADNGPGIPAEHLEHVFRRFYRADEHRDRESGGVGLGLSLVRATAEAHGGSATLESRVGEGTRAVLALPLVRNGRDG